MHVLNNGVSHDLRMCHRVLKIAVLAAEAKGSLCSTFQGIQMNQKITFDEVMAVLATASRIVMEEGSLVEVDVPIKVVGDIHGQYEVSTFQNSSYS